MRLHPIESGQILLRVIAARPPRSGPGKVPRTLLASLTRRGAWCPVPVFLIEHPQHGPLLIDAGYDPRIEDDPAETLGFLFGRVMMRHRLAAPSAREQVRARGVDPDAIPLVVLTHLHLDHISGAREWPSATFAVARVERQAAGRQRGPGPYVRRHLETIERWRELDFERDGESFEGFERTIDLFGDGSLRLISTPGHAPGHVAVLVRLADRHALLCGDAAMTTRELGERLVDGIVLDQDAYLRSGDQMRAFVADHPETLVIPSHDAELFARLEPTYE